MLIDEHPQPKRLRTTGPHHSVVALWNAKPSPLVEALRKTLYAPDDPSSLAPSQQTMLEVFRIDAGTEDSVARMPIKLLVKVEPGKVAWDQGMRIARRCHQVLKSFQLGDIDCEVFEADIALFGGAVSRLFPSSKFCPLPPTVQLFVFSPSFFQG